MSDQKDCCSICLEPLHHEDPTPTGFVAAGRRVPTYWVWPCLHRVHTECITRSQASLRSIEASCFVCRWPAGSDARLHFERLYGAELSRVPVTARMSCHGAGECPGNHNDYGRASAVASRRIEVCLEKNGGQFMHVWMTSFMTIAQVLDDWTPEDLKDANPVVVVNGGLARPDMVLSGFPTNGSLLRMMIQQPMGW